MKVISGNLKGRNILGYNIEGTRPTMDRVKESLFAMIQDKISNSIVLDLFAGSGNYGIEALSRNANKVYFNDLNKECLKVIKKNLENFQMLDKSIIYNLDYLKCLNMLQKNSITFDIIFLDPPYKEHILNDILDFIEKNHLLNPNGLIIVEFQDEKLLDNYNNLKKIKERIYSNKKVYIYEELINE